VDSPTDRARADLQDIYARGEDLFGGAQADEYAAGLESSVELLSTFSRAARDRTATRRRLRAYPFRSDLIVSVMDDEDILIVRIRHAHDDWVSNPV
jgi:toxin ParE1/3/4